MMTSFGAKMTRLTNQNSRCRRNQAKQNNFSIATPELRPDFCHSLLSMFQRAEILVTASIVTFFSAIISSQSPATR
jgi:hypothetical protein